MTEGSLPGLDYVAGYDGQAKCSLCDRGGVPLLSRKGGHVALCESCTHLAYLAWGSLPGEALPDLPVSSRRVSTVAVLVARRRVVRRLDAPAGAPEGEQLTKAASELSSSYEFLLERLPGGIFQPPAATCTGDVTKAALDALSSVGASSWPALLESLYVGYTPRGRLMSVALATGWSGGPEVEQACEWRPWPPSRHAGAMGGFYQGVEAAWPLRTHKHSSQQERGEVSVRMREAARKYVELQAALRAGPTTDASMLAAYRSAMTEDEVAVAKLVRKAAEEEEEVARLATRPASTTTALVVPTPAAQGDDGPEDGDEVAGEDGAEGGEDGGGAAKVVAKKVPEPGFAR